MKLLPMGAAMIVGFSVAFAMAPALADHPRQWVPQYAGQDVFNLTNRRVGRIVGYIDIRGTPGVIIASADRSNRRTFLAPADDLGKRDEGGIFLLLSDASVSNLPTYRPGRLPFW